MAKSSGNSAATQIQRIASQTQLQLQQMVNSSNELQARYNKQEAEASRAWQTQMSKTAHQMEVEDLKKAGLNPVLSSGGSGAQSYTTSSASITPESGASAAAGVQEAQIGSIGNMESSRIQAAATRKAAAVSAAAVRSAAAQSAAAQMYAASLDYEGRKYASDASVKSTKIKAAADKWISQNKQAGSWSALFDKYLSRLTDSSVRSGVKALNNKFITGGNKLANNVGKYFANSGKITAGNFKLTTEGKNQVNSYLRNAGLAVNAANRKRFVQSYVFKDSSAHNSLMTSYVTTHWKHKAKPTVTPVTSAHKTRRNLR